jgi:hypothetical protein
MQPPVLHRGIGMPTSCRSCGKRIVFALMAVSGKTAPFEEDAAGLYILENGAARHVGKSPLQLELGEVAPTRYTSHFANCPDASKWRGEK